MRILTLIAIAFLSLPVHAADKLTEVWASTCFAVQDRFPDRVDCYEIPAPQLYLLENDRIEQADGTVFRLSAGAYVGDGKILLSKRYRDSNPDFRYYETIVHEIAHYVMDYSGVFPLSSGTETDCFSEYHAWDIADAYVNKHYRNQRSGTRIAQSSSWGHNYPHCEGFSKADYRAGLDGD